VPHGRHDTDCSLNGLQDAFGVQDTSLVQRAPYKETKMRTETMDSDASKWESNTEKLRPRATEDEDVPYGPHPIVLPNLREPDASICGCRRSELERLADAAGPLPTQERRRPRAAIGMAGYSFAGDCG